MLCTVLRRILVVLLWGCVAGAVLAGPFSEKLTFRQPDGSEIILQGEGDEFYAVFETTDGYTVAFNHSTKAYHYALLSTDGSELRPVGPPIGQVDPATLGLTKHLRVSREARDRQVAERFQRWDTGMEVTRRWKEQKEAARRARESSLASGIEFAPPASATMGSKVGLTLLIDFSDDPATIPQAEIVDFCNGDHYAGYGNNGSVWRYFYDNSRGMLDYRNVVTIYIRMAQPKTYYNDTSKECGGQGNVLIRDAIEIMKALPNYTTEILPTFDSLTVDGSGRVAACNVFYAGGNGGVWSYGLWPHSWSLYYAGAQDLGNGKSVYRYQITNIGTSLALGTFCHENGHMLLGYPDIYDYEYDSYGGAGKFCLMGYGGSGPNPTQINAYLKRASGWASTVEINAQSLLPGSLSASGAEFNKFYRFQKPGVTTEYYLVENRQTADRDATLPGGGICIWHIDELGSRDNQSTTYNTTHANYEVSLVQADNLFDLQKDRNSGDANDLFYSGNPAAGYANRFHDLTAPSAKWWDGSNSGLYVADFSSRSATMTFQIGAPGVKIVVAEVALTTESCSSPTGAIDPGETVTVNVALQNLGNIATANLVATLLPIEGVTAPGTPQNYGALTVGGSWASRSFAFTAAGACGQTISMILQLQDGATDLGLVTNTFYLGSLNPTWSENFDGVTSPDLPPDWTSTSGNGQTPWVTSSAQKDTVPNAAFVPDPAATSISDLISPPFTVSSATAQVSFRHYYLTEMSYDGGVLEIRVGDGSFTDILVAGGSFVAGGYRYTFSPVNPLGARSAWMGDSGGFMTTTVNLPANAAGQVVQLRWRFASDASVGRTGWYVDNVTFKDLLCCTGATALLTVTPAEPFESSGHAGGPFSPASETYELANSGSTAMAWTASSDQDWVTVSPSNGTLAPGSGIGIELSINPSATILAVGTHTAVVNFNNASGGAGSTSRSVNLTVNARPPVAGFSATPTTGTAPLAVTFTDQSTGTVDTWLWSFGDNTTSIARNPSHTYSAAGNHTVSLTAGGPGGSSTLTRQNYIAVMPGVPPAPSGLTAQAGNAFVALNWTASLTAASYNVKRATSKRGPFGTVATGITKTSWVDTGLKNGTVYYYVVSASNAAGEGPNSPQVSAKPVADRLKPQSPASDRAPLAAVR